MLGPIRRAGLLGLKKMQGKTTTALPAFAVRCNSAVSFTDKERGEEARYFLEDDERKKKMLRAKMEQILELEDHHADKQQLVEMLETSEKKESSPILSRLQKWTYAVPVAVLVGVPTLVNEIFVIDMETQILAAFLLTIAAVRNEFGSAIGQSFESEKQEIADKMKQVDDAMLKNVHHSVAVNENLLDLESQVKEIHALTDDMAVVQADLLNGQQEHKYREAIAKKLDALVALEDTASNAIRTRMLTKVHQDVVNTFTKDAKAKDAALQHALSVISSSSSGSAAKMSKDIVGDYFASALKNYKEEYMKQPAGSDEIIQQLEKDMANIIKPPSVGLSGGNVYEYKGEKAAH